MKFCLFQIIPQWGFFLSNTSYLIFFQSLKSWVKRHGFQSLGFHRPDLEVRPKGWRRTACSLITLSTFSEGEAAPSLCKGEKTAPQGNHVLKGNHCQWPRAQHLLRTLIRSVIILFFKLPLVFHFFQLKGQWRSGATRALGPSLSKSDYCTLEGVSAATQTRREAGF